ncbi:acyclic terpene utilization AtuA family protein [Rhodococcus sp. NPDC057529]|uniref:acyclic terpene utilization AtuA family protein n=1 Tax=Rhodococcus sp. NPDC057529 TaxID=3346158 RepID=UPI003670FB48
MTETPSDRDGVLRVGAFSGFYGDSPDNMSILLQDGVDVLIGDYLAELTMLILRKNEMRGAPGYARTFVTQLRDNLPRIAASGVKVVANAGGLDPEGCANEIRAVIESLGLDLTVAAIVGDDLTEELAGNLGKTAELANIDTGEVLDLGQHEIMTANAYLGAWPIVEALHAGADIVVCPRMTDASLVVGPAAWHFGWEATAWDQLAGAVVAGHVIECGGQASGGNYSHFHQYEDLGYPGLPIAEIRPDGSSVITKVGDSGGVVTVDTIKAQLFYEIGGAEYQNPDVVTHLTSLTLTDLGGHRVEIGSVKGSRPTSTTKLALTYEGGFRNSMTIGLTGGHVAEKAAWLRRQVEGRVGGPDYFDGFRMTVIGPAREVDGTYDEATALVTFNVRDRDVKKVSRQAFSDKIVQLCLASIPGFYMTTPPQKERLYGVQWPCLIDKSVLHPIVRIAGVEDREVEWPDFSDINETPRPEPAAPDTDIPDGPARRVTLGSVAATRSGDKGGKANVGVWGRSAGAYAWLRSYLTVERFAELVPEAHGLRVERHEFPNLLGLNFLVYGWLEDGVSSCLRIDAQAKGVGEYLASKTVDVPQGLLGDPDKM